VLEVRVCNKRKGPDGLITSAGAKSRLGQDRMNAEPDFSPSLYIIYISNLIYTYVKN